ncbi:MAG: metallophosphoesterase [Planctomycetota bacterium]|nr:metallophosphoesterase [Planctomycetota bacterium]
MHAPNRPWMWVLAVVLCAAARAEEPAIPPLPEGIGPFNPEPLMKKLEEDTKEDKFAFAVLGDTKHSKTFSGKVVPFVAQTVKPAFVLTTGDMVQFGGGSTGPDYWSRLSKEAGEDMKARPWWPAIGNHEVGGGPILNKKDEKEIPKNIDLGRAYFKQFYGLKSDYYSFTFRNAAFIALPWRYPNEKDGTQAWLEGELKKFKAEGKLIFCFNHCPFYTVGSKSPNDVPGKPTDVTKLFETYGVRAVFSGHDHGYYRTVRNGVLYATSAGGGAELYELKRRAEAQAEDVYFGVSTAKDGAKKYLYVHGEKKAEKTYDEPQQFLCVISVDGPRATMKTLTVAGEVWDEVELAK